MTDEEYTKSQIDFVKEQEMARQKQIAPAPIVLDDEEEGAELQPATQSSAEFALANQLLGRIQLGQGLAKVVTVTTLLDLQRIKESKGYRHLPIIADGKTVTVTTFPEFCKLLGMSYEKVNQDLNNLSAFGAEALESMQEMGLGYRQMRQLRKIPDEERNVIIEQITQDTTDKEELQRNILDLIQTQSRMNDEKLKEVEAEKAAALQAVEAEKTAREKAERKMKQELADKDALIQVKNEKIEELHSEHNSDMQTPDGRVAGAEKLLNEYFANLVNGLIVRKSELTGDYAFGGVVGINALFAKVASACGGKFPEHLQELIKSQVARVHTELDSALTNIGLDDDAIEFDEYVPDANDVPFQR